MLDRAGRFEGWTATPLYEKSLSRGGPRTGPSGLTRSPIDQGEPGVSLNHDARELARFSAASS